MIKFLSNNELFTRTVSGSILLGCMAGAYLHSVTMFTFFLLGILLVILFFEWPQLMPTTPIRYALISLVYPTFPFLCLIYLNYRYHFDNLWLPLYPFLIAWSADTFGYLVGKTIGRHKMCPSVSPGKTWEGFAGSIAGIMLINLLIMPKMNISIFGYYNHLWYFLGPVQGWLIFILFCTAQTSLAFLGGFFLSKLKRMSNVKDAGTILPGHGGFLDRFDSVLTTVLFVWVLIWCKKFLG